MKNKYLINFSKKFFFLSQGWKYFQKIDFSVPGMGKIPENLFFCLWRILFLRAVQYQDWRFRNQEMNTPKMKRYKLWINSRCREGCKREVLTAGKRTRDSIEEKERWSCTEMKTKEQETWRWSSQKLKEVSSLACVCFYYFPATDSRDSKPAIQRMDSVPAKLLIS